MKDSKKLSKGITLISLVITVIALLILAGVALAMLTGENGIMTRAKTAREQHQAGQELEKNRLSGMEDVMGQYLGNTAVGSTTSGSNSGTSSGSETGGTLQSQEPVTVTFYANSGDTEAYDTKTVNVGEAIGSSNMPTNPTKDNYTFTGWKSELTSSTIINSNTSVYADWAASDVAAGTAISDSSYYGNYFDLGTEIFGTITNGKYSSSKMLGVESSTIKADWRIFSKDSTGVWLILADCLPVDGSEINTFITGTGTNQIGLVTKTGNDLNSYPYSVWSGGTDRSDLITRLRANWKGLLPSSLQSNPNITAVGALTVSEWQAGWNSKYTGTEQISVSGNETNGYSTLSMSSKAGCGNTLYFPHKERQGNNPGYWLASPRSGSGYGDQVMSVNFGGSFNSMVYKGTNGINFYGVRPAVHLASSVNIKCDSITGVWKISN